MTTKEKALSQNKFIHRYIIAAAHAILWIAALSLAAYVHLDNRFTPHQALLFSTLVAHSANRGNFRKLKIRRWIILNIFVAVTLSILFLLTANQWLLAGIIATAGWQKYMDGRIPPRLEETLERK